MASFAYTPAKTLIANGGLNFAEAGADLRLILVMTNSTADTDQDTQYVSGIGTLDEMDGANYVRKACGTQVVAEDAANNRAEFSFDAVTWTALGAGTRQVLGVVLYKHVTNDADSPLIAWVDTGGFPFTANGGNVTLTVSADGFIQIT
jgi:hypothetical protein